MIVVIDNYDSFTYNLVQYIGEIMTKKGDKLDKRIKAGGIKVFRNDKTTTQEIEKLSPATIVISPGPCTPLEAGISNDVVAHFGGKIPILGVCLGHQCIGHVFGGKIVRADRIMHGKTSFIHHDGKIIYEGLPNPFEATRYHSLIVKRETVPDVLEITAQTEQGEIMGLRHKKFTVEGVQFHPESILTNLGKDLLFNFLKINGGSWKK